MGPTQRYPRGLLELFGLKGVSPPAVLADFYQATVDVTQLLGNSQKQIRSVNNAAAAVNTFVTLTVPASETWILYHAAPSIVVPAGLTDIALAMTMEGSTVSWKREGAGVAVGETLPCAPFMPPYPYVLLSGQTMSAVMLRLTGAANASLTLTALVGVLS